MTANETKTPPQMTDALCLAIGDWLSCGESFDVLYDFNGAWVFVAGDVAIRIRGDVELFKIYSFEPFRQVMLNRDSVEAE